MANTWFESVAEAQRRARRRLPRSVYGALVAGAERGLTARDNVAAFDELGFAPPHRGACTTSELDTTVMGQPLALPVLISPTGVQAVHPDGEVAVARAAAARGTAIGLSSYASKPLEEVVAATPMTLFQGRRHSPTRSWRDEIKLTVPVLYGVDPAGIVTDWISGQIVSLLPSPCEEQQNHDADGGSLAEVARGLLDETVDRALGLPTARQAAA